MKRRRLSCMTATLAFGISLPALADPFAEATLTVFEAASPRQVELAPPPTPTLTVFEPDGAREVAMQTSWPAIQGGGYLKLSSGHRRDNMRFTIGGKGGPNILSELEWQAPATQIRADGVWTHASGATIKGYLAYAHTYAEGRNRDSDYALDNRQAEFSRSYADTTGSAMVDLLFGAGWHLPLGASASLTPLAGFARYESTYRSSNGRQVVSSAANAALLGIDDWDETLGAFTGLHSRYRPVWSSIWLGLDGELKAGDRFTLQGGIRRHWFKYRAEADWNLRGDLAHPVSFKHKDQGTGWEAEIGAAFRLSGEHRLTFDLSKRKMKTRQGEDTTYFHDGTSGTIDLGETVLDSWSARLGYRYDY